MLHNVSMDFGCRTCPGDVWHTSKNLWKQVLRDIVSCSANWRKELLQYTHSIHVWYIYLHCHEIQTHVGKYCIPYMDAIHPLFTNPSVRWCWTDVLAFVDHLLQFFLQACKNSNLPSTVDGWNPVSLYQVGCIKPLKWLDTLPMTWYGIALPSPVWLNGKNSIPEDRRGGELIFPVLDFCHKKQLKECQQNLFFSTYIKWKTSVTKAPFE